jgi:hypothetical protein
MIHETGAERTALTPTTQGIRVIATADKGVASTKTVPTPNRTA